MIKRYNGLSHCDILTGSVYVSILVATCTPEVQWYSWISVGTSVTRFVDRSPVTPQTVLENYETDL